MEERRGIASSPATGMAEERLTHEAKEWFIPIFGEDDHQQTDPEANSKHRIPKAPAKFLEYKQDKKYFDPQVVSLGPYHHDDEHLKPMEKHKITAAKQFVNELKDKTGGRRTIYEMFMELTGDLKRCYDADGVADMSDDVFSRMMFLDGCFVLHCVEKIIGRQETKLEMSNNLIPFIIRDMFLIENQLPFKVLDALMNLRWGSSLGGTEKILKFIEWEVLMPMGMFNSFSSHRSVSRIEHVSPLHLLDFLRTILLDFPPSNWEEKIKDRPRNFGSVTELKEIGIRFEKRYTLSLMDISFEEHLLFPRLLLPTMFINDITISLLLNLTAFEMCSEIHSGSGVISYIRFMDSLIKHEADVKELRSKGILHHSLGSDEEVARLFNKWPADVMNNLALYGDISLRIRWHRDRKVNIAAWLEKYFGRTWTVISVGSGCILLVLTAIQTYLTAFPRR